MRCPGLFFFKQGRPIQACLCRNSGPAGLDTGSSSRFPQARCSQMVRAASLHPTPIKQQGPAPSSAAPPPSCGSLVHVARLDAPRQRTHTVTGLWFILLPTMSLASPTWLQAVGMPACLYAICQNPFCHPSAGGCLCPCEQGGRAGVSSPGQSGQAWQVLALTLIS